MSTVSFDTGDSAESIEFEQEWADRYAGDENAFFPLGPVFAGFVRETFGSSGTPAVLRASVGDRTVLFWPLSLVVHSPNGLPLRSLMHRNGRHAIYGNPLVGGSVPYSLLTETLASVRNADSISLSRLTHDNRIPALHDDRTVMLGSPDPIVDLQTPCQIGGKNRRELARSLRALGRAGDLHTEVLEGLDLQAYGESFADLHTRLKLHQKQWPVFAEHRGSRNAIGPALSRPTLSAHSAMVRISLDGRSVGMLLMFHDRGIVTTWRSAWDPDLKKYGIGSLLLNNAIEWARNRGFRLLRLGPGDEAYKAIWATDTSLTAARLFCRRPTIRSLADRIVARVIRSN